MDSVDLSVETLDFRVSHLSVLNHFLSYLLIILRRLVAVSVRAWHIGDIDRLLSLGSNNLSNHSVESMDELRVQDKILLDVEDELEAEVGNSRLILPVLSKLFFTKSSVLFVSCLIRVLLKVKGERPLGKLLCDQKVLNEALDSIGCELEASVLRVGEDVV